MTAIALFNRSVYKELDIDDAVSVKQSTTSVDEPISTTMRNEVNM